MRWLLAAGVCFASAVALGAGAVHAAGTSALATIKVSNTSSKVVKSTVLDPDHRYRLTVSGTVSDWCTASSCPPGDPAKTAQPRVGVDGVWCYAKWRCPTPEAWQQLNINGKGILDFAGLTPADRPYSSSHKYTIVFDGVSGALSLGSSDALAGSGGDNSGSYTVTITDLGPAGAAPSAAVKKLQSDLAKLGLYTGPIDGRLDARTTAAIKKFQRDVGVTVDGDCDAKCLTALRKALGLDDPALPAGAAPTSRSTVTKLQSDLAKLGFYTGPLDGRYGGSVADAVKRFQLQAHIPADGKCTLRCQLAIVNALTS
jgi:peptidoglycan hydrolase-like protein with peptidoglycan-binding domain